MHKLRIYADTSVIGGDGDAEFSEAIRLFNSVNMANGYRPVDIRSPLEVAYGEED